MALCIGLAGRLPAVSPDIRCVARLAPPAKDKMLKHRRSV